MSTQLVPYLNFPGNTAEAFDYYHSVFGGDLQVTTFSDYGLEDMPQDGTMHAELKTDHFVLMASDAMPGAESASGGTKIHLAFISDDVTLLSEWFEQLAEGGAVDQPLATQIWGDTYGHLTDRYGVQWLFNISSAVAA